MKKLIYALMMCVTLTCNADTEPKKLDVLVTINPIYSLAKKITGNKANLSLLITSAQSPHDYHLSPKNLHAMQNADAIVMVDSKFETFLSTYIEHNSNINKKIILLSGAPNLLLLKSRFTGLLENKSQDKEQDNHEHCHEHGHSHEDGHSHEHNHDHGTTDLHFW